MFHERPSIGMTSLATLIDAYQAAVRAQDRAREAYETAEPHRRAQARQDLAKATLRVVASATTLHEAIERDPSTAARPAAGSDRHEELLRVFLGGSSRAKATPKDPDAA